MSASAATKEQLQQLETKLKNQKQQAVLLDQQEHETSESLKTLRQKLIDATSALQDKAETEDRLETRSDELEDEINVKTKALDDEKQKLGLLTSALLRLSRQPPETFFLQSNLTTDHIHRAIVLQAILPRIKDQTENIARDMAALGDMQAQLDQQKKLVAASEENLHGQQHELDQMIKTRQGMLQQTEAQKQATALQLVSLANEAKDLRQLLEKVAPKRPPSSKQTPSLHATFKPPVAGNLLRGFGARDADGVMSQGLTYTALPGSPVVAPEAGRVVFAGPFRGYGQILILQHAGGFHSFLAGFGRIDADMGQDVERGEPLGVLPAKTGSRPELYFEWRHNNDPVDPMTGGMALSKTP